MRVNSIWYLFFILLTGCTNDEFPVGIYDYQVERLLNAGSEKVWSKEINSLECTDSLKLFITTSTEPGFTITIADLIPTETCNNFDTTNILNAYASSGTEGQLFTDSLIFDNEDFWLVRFITSASLEIETSYGETQIFSNSQ